MGIHQPNDSTQISRLRYWQQQQLDRPRRLSINSPKSLRRRQRECPSSQKSPDRRPYPGQVFTQSWIKGRFTRRPLAALLIFSASLIMALLQIGSWPQAKRQSNILPSQPRISPSPAELMAQAEELFATPDSLGAIAIGVAEGTRTPAGGRTSLWQQHTDPGNFAENRGTFSWQLEATSIADAEQRGLDRVRQAAIPHILQDAEKTGIALNIELLVQGADLWNQSPQAGADFIENLKQCQQRETQASAAVLCARMESYVSPRTGKVEAAGFANDPGLLRDDQQRRMQAIQATLQQNPRIAQVHPINRPIQ